MDRNKTIAGVTALVVLGLGVAWGMGYFSQDPVVAEVVKAQQQMIEGGERPTKEQRDAMRERFQSMTDQQRRAAFEAMRPAMIKMMNERMKEFFNRSPEEIQKDISERADRIIAARAERKNNSTANRPGGRGNLSEAERDERRKKMLDFIPAENRAQFSQIRGMINKELDSRGEEPMSGPDMRAMFGRGGMRGGKKKGA